MRAERTEVLIVGAGPIGLLAANCLTEAGVSVAVIDREERTTSRSYACALHGRSLQVLQRLGLAEEVLALGRRVTTVGFYDGPNRRAEVRLDALGGEFPFILIVPQNAFEELLERRLRQKGGVAVLWSHRFDAYQEEVENLAVTVQALGGTATGYIVPHWETTVKREFTIRAHFLIGADGQNSLVRQRAGIDYARLAAPSFFAAYEFESDTPCEDEVRVVLDDGSTNVLWPLPGNRHRWTFQLLKHQPAGEFPEKERSAVRFAQAVVDERIRQHVQKIAQERAPWFSARVTDVTWCTDVMFEQRLASFFGRNRCWLAGDAAHQTGPVGAQSMNVGLCEAESLADKLRRILHEDAPVTLLEDYDAEGQDAWRGLLNLDGALGARDVANPWIRERMGRILPCLPASGDDLGRLAGQLGLDFRLRAR